MGDEVRRTQRGNNNAYCQDNETSWFDWSLLERHADVRRFVTHARRRCGSTASLADERVSADARANCCAPAGRRGTASRLNEPDWGHDSHTLAVTTPMPGGRCAAPDRRMPTGSRWSSRCRLFPCPPRVACARRHVARGTRRCVAPAGRAGGGCRSRMPCRRARWCSSPRRRVPHDHSASRRAQVRYPDPSHGPGQRLRPRADCPRPSAAGLLIRDAVRAGRPTRPAVLRSAPGPAPGSSPAAGCVPA